MPYSHPASCRVDLEDLGSNARTFISHSIQLNAENDQSQKESRPSCTNGASQRNISGGYTMSRSSEFRLLQALQDSSAARQPEAAQRAVGSASTV
jgi:hypothetical protein